MKKIILLISILSFIGYRELGAQGSKLKIIQVGCLDINKVIRVVSSSLAIQSKLVGADNEVQKKIAEIEKIIALLAAEKGKAENSDQQKQSIDSQIQFEKKKISDLLKSKLGEKELDINANQLSQPMIRSIFRTISDVASKNGYSIILDKNQGVIYSSSDVDITDLVLDQIGN